MIDRIENKRFRSLVLLSVPMLTAVVIFVIWSADTSAQRNYTSTFTDIGERSEASVLASGEQYRINKRGERYGSARDIDIGMLDLVLAYGTNGQIGYIRAVDLNEPIPKSPEEAANYRTTDKLINLYAEDGVTIIGQFMIQGNYRTATKPE